MYEIKNVNILHTGGRNYLFYGELENGLFFAYGMDEIIFYNENYENSLSSNGFLWERRHKVKQLTAAADIEAFKQNLKEHLDWRYHNLI